MDVEKVMCMNAGEGETSYANNSLHQRRVMLKMRPILEDTVKNVVSTTFPTCIKVADLGCSSGPNTLLVSSDIIKTIHGIYEQMNYKSPEFQVFLNDLPENDFNTVFKSLPAFYTKLKEEKGNLGPTFVAGVPGSFYGRLFPSRSLHFVHSSNSIHWLSQVREEVNELNNIKNKLYRSLIVFCRKLILVPDGLANNKGNVFMAKTSSPRVFKAYMEQFHRDFSNFLSLRSEEIMPGGQMLLTFLGRSAMDPTVNDCCKHMELLSKSLLDLVAEGLVNEADVDSCNSPHYRPYWGEVREIIQNEGSFDIVKLETYGFNWDPSDNSDNQASVFDKKRSGQNVGKWFRAVSEAMLASHSGERAMDRLFARFAEHVGEHLSVEKTKDLFIVVSLTKK